MRGEENELERKEGRGRIKGRTKKNQYKKKMQTDWAYRLGYASG